MYFTRHADNILSEGKFRASETEKKKFEDSPQKKTNEKRLKNLEKNLEKVRTNGGWGRVGWSWRVGWR